jgi:hypothetical protein
MAKKVTEISPPKTTEIQKRDKKVEGALTYRGIEKEEIDRIKKK